MRHTPPTRPRAEPTITLINVVFLLLVFFLIAGQLSPPLDQDLTLASVSDLAPTQAPEALLITADGRLFYKGAPTDAAQFWRAQQAASGKGAQTLSTIRLRIVPDRDLPAYRLLSVAAQLRALGADDLWVVTERGLRPGG